MLLRQIEAIKFASDWKKKGQQVGGKVFKAKFINCIYEARTSRPLPVSSSSSAEDMRSFKTFKKDYQALIAARNLLLELYLEVSLYFDCWILLTFI